MGLARVFLLDLGWAVDLGWCGCCGPASVGAREEGDGRLGGALECDFLGAA